MFETTSLNITAPSFDEITKSLPFSDLNQNHFIIYLDNNRIESDIKTDYGKKLLKILIDEISIKLNVNPDINSFDLIDHFDRKIIKLLSGDNIIWIHVTALINLSDEKKVVLKTLNVTDFMGEYLEKINLLEEKIGVIDDYFEETKNNYRRELHLASIKLQDKENKIHQIYEFIQKQDGIDQEIKDELSRMISNKAKHKSLDFDFKKIGLDDNNFYKKLSSLFPELTDSELRICNLIKKGLSNTEMSNFLRKSTRTIENHRFRIRKKLDLDHKHSLSTFLKSI